MFAVGMQIRLHPPHVFTTVGHKYHLLVFLHPLGLHDFPQAPAWFLVIGLDEGKTLGRRNVLSFRPSESHHTAARDHLEPALLVSGPHITAINTHRDGAIRQWRLLLFLFLRWKRIAWPFFAQFRLHPLGGPLQMFAYRFMVRRRAHGQYFLQQIGHLLERNQRSPLGFQIQQLRTSSASQPNRRWPESFRPFGLAPTAAPP